MNHQEFNSTEENLKTAAAATNEAVNNEEISDRRAALKKSGLILGAALLGGISSRVSAQNNGTMMQPPMGGMMNNGMMRSDMTMQWKPGTQERLMKVTNMTSRDDRGVPTSGVIKEGKSSPSDVDILNFALTLEYLEADFYTRVVQADNNRSYLTGRVKDLARILMRDETTHVQAVSDAVRALGGTPVSKPEFVFPENAFISPIGFLMLSSELEETGVSAYLGQGAYVKRPDVLDFAASIYGNETRHAGLIKHYLGNSSPMNMEMPRNRMEIGMRVKPFFANPQMMPASMMTS